MNNNLKVKNKGIPADMGQDDATTSASPVPVEYSGLMKTKNSKKDKGTNFGDLKENWDDLSDMKMKSLLVDDDDDLSNFLPDDDDEEMKRLLDDDDEDEDCGDPTCPVHGTGSDDEKEKEDDERVEHSKKVRFRANTNDYTFTAEGPFVYTIYGHCIQNWIAENAEDYMIVGETSSMEMQTDYETYEQIFTLGHIVFRWEGQMYEYRTIARETINYVSSRNNIDKLVKTLKKYIKQKNPLRGKNIYASDAGLLMKRVEDITFEQVILDQHMKDDIYDNVIFQLMNLDDNNGIIMYGLPGTGKSLTCSAIINEANKNGYSTCYITNKINYTALEEFIYKFLSPCIVIFEDIDSMGQSREQTLNTDISNLLQFISGISEKNDKIIFIATTNYIEHLDKAIANRPMRFNRRYLFELPKDNEIDQLLDLYFSKYDLSKDQYKLCYKKQFTGSHVREVLRTCELMSLRKLKLQNPEATVKDLTTEQINAVFADGVKAVADSFKTGKTEIGYKP